jgi:hypothetical protein
VPQLIHPPFRRATLNDTGTLAEFVELASEGLAVYLWSKLAGTGRDPWNIGSERVRSETGGISYRNAIIAELAGRPAAGLISYSLPAQSEIHFRQATCDTCTAARTHEPSPWYMVLMCLLPIRSTEEAARALHSSPSPTGLPLQSERRA